jgi:hypothetical protein
VSTDKNDVRANDHLLLEELRKNGVEIKNSRVIKCPFHNDKTPSARIELHGGIWRFRCRAAGCETCEDIFGIRAKFSGRTSQEEMKDWRAAQPHDNSPRPRTSPRPGTGTPAGFYETKEKIDRATAAVHAAESRPGDAEPREERPDTSRQSPPPGSQEKPRDVERPVSKPFSRPVPKAAGAPSIEPCDPPMGENGKPKSGKWVKFNGQETREFDSVEEWRGFYEKLPGKTVFDFSPGLVDPRVGEMRWLKLRIEPGFGDKGKTFVTAHVHDGKVYGCWPEGVKPLYMNATAHKLYAEGKLNEVIVVEGEKKANALDEFEEPAVSSPLGADKGGTKMLQIDWSILANLSCLFWPDFDPFDKDGDRPGEVYMKNLATHLGGVFDVTPYWIDVDKLGLPEKGDVVDFIALCQREGAVKETLEGVLGRRRELVRPLDDAPTRWRPFPMNALPPVMAELCQQAETSIGADPTYTILPLLVVCGGAIGNSTLVRMSRTWTESPVLWAAVIGAPSAKKGPMQRLAVDPVHEYQAFSDTQFKLRKGDAQKLARFEPNSHESDECEEDCSPHFYTTSATVEAINDRLSVSPRGLIVAREELSAHLQSMNQYKERGSDRETWLEYYDARRSKVDRKTGKQTSNIPRAFVSLLGGIQPKVFARLIRQEDFDSGFAQRFIMTMPPRREDKLSKSDIDAHVQLQVTNAIRSLYSIPLAMNEHEEPVPNEVRLSSQANVIWEAWYNEVASLINRLDEGDPAFDALPKMRAVSLRIALILQLFSAASSEAGFARDEISEPSMRRAVAITRWLIREQRRIFTTLRQTSSEAALEKIEAIARSISANGCFSFHDYKRKRGRKDNPDAEIELLKSKGRITETNLNKSGKGRPSPGFKLA